MHFPQIHGGLSGRGSPFGGGAQPLRHACGVTPPLPRGGLGIPQSFPSQFKVFLSARGSPTRGNGDDRRQWRKQGGAVGAAASRMRAAAKQTLGAATRPWRAKQTERLYEGEPFLCRKVRLLASPVSFWRIICYNGFAALPAHFVREGGESNELYSIFCSVCRSKCNVVLHLQVA